MSDCFVPNTSTHMRGQPPYGLKQMDGSLGGDDSSGCADHTRSERKRTTLKKLEAECSSFVSSTQVKLVATDMDGTFLNSDHVPSARNILAFRMAQEQGYVVAAATGRSRVGTLSSLKEQAGEMRFHNGYPGVYLNGLSVYGPSGEVVFERRLEREMCFRILNFAFNRLGLIEHVTCYGPDRIYSLRHSPYTTRSANIFGEPPPVVIRRSDGKPTTTEDLHLLTDLPICKMLFIHNKDTVLWLRRVVEAEFGDAISIVSTDPHFIELLPPGESKGRGLSRLLEHLNIHHDHAVALGDGENDIEMLRLCGFSYAMDNAPDSVKQAAKNKAVHHDADGFAEALEELLGVVTSEVVEEHLAVEPQ